MPSAEALRRAIQVARAGRKAEARDLFMQIVEEDPQNEVAWIWLCGLVDLLEDRIIACENVLTINPANEKMRAYLMDLKRQREAASARTNIDAAARLLRRAEEHAERNEISAALQLARQALEKHPGHEGSLLFIAGNSSNVDEQIAALKKARRLNPSNTETALALKEAQYLKTNPLSAATRLEQMGRFEEALNVYRELAARAKNSTEFDHFYRQIIRIEGLQKEKIRFIAPASSIARLAFSWPLLYLSLALIQVGLNPFGHPALYLWLGLPFVGLGSLLLSLAEVRSRHILWEKLFDEHGDGSTFARFVTAAGGWFLILIPHLLLVLDSLSRLLDFRIPPMP
jgi:tetratricopeptide (TPR) repeat protein